MLFSLIAASLSRKLIVDFYFVCLFFGTKEGINLWPLASVAN